MINGTLEFLYLWVLLNVIFSALLKLATKNIGNALKIVTAIVSAAVLLLPIQGVSVLGYALAINPILSVGGLLFWGMLLWRIWGQNAVLSHSENIQFLCWNVFLSLILYLSAMNFIQFDIYHLGYGSILLLAIFALVSISLLFVKSPLFFVFVAYIMGYNLGLAHSHNLFDYMVDPLVAIASLGIILYQAGKLALEKQWMTKVELVVIPTMMFLVLLGVLLRIARIEFYRYVYVVEDGPIEWLTVASLLSGCIICIARAISLKKYKSSFFIFCTLFLAFLFFFGAGEEISWGQRIFGIVSPEFFQKNNAQGETNLHNTIIAGIKINKLFFGLLLSIFVVSYLVLSPVLYQKSPGIKKFIDTFAIPIPRNVHLITYVLLFIILFTLIPSKSKRGELLELGGTTVFTCIVLAPRNKETFDKEEEKE